MSSELVIPPPKDYSLRRLISVLVARTMGGLEPRDCSETEFSEQVLAVHIGRPARSNGAFIPLTVRASGLDTKTGSGGGYLTQQDVGSEIVASLRAKSVLSRAGAQIFSDLQHSLEIVVQTSGNAATWSPENPGTDVAEIDPVFSVRNFSPKTLLSTVMVSRRLLRQATPDVEAFIRADFGRALAEAIDAAGLNGPGTSNQPVGILKTPGIGDHPLGVNGGTLTGDDVLALENLVGQANADLTAWIATPALRKKLRQTPRFASGTNEPLWRDDNTILGVPAFATMGMPGNVTKGSSADCTSLLTGDFTNFISALWSLEIQIDPYSRKKSGMVEVSVFAMADTGVLRPATLAATQDARP